MMRIIQLKIRKNTPLYIFFTYNFLLQISIEIVLRDGIRTFCVLLYFAQYGST
jgi:hypothetical protein